MDSQVAVQYIVAPEGATYKIRTRVSSLSSTSRHSVAEVRLGLVGPPVFGLFRKIYYILYTTSTSGSYILPL